MAGKNEGEFKQFADWLGAYSEKKPDMGKCWKCGAPRFDRKTDKNDLREIKASRVDYLLGVYDRLAWVECKSGETSFAWADDEEGSGMGIRKGQRIWMNDKTHQGISCWIFLTVGNGRAPLGRESYLLYWGSWLKVEAQLIERGMKSIPWKRNRMANSVINLQDSFAEFELTWLSNTGWVLPQGHPITFFMPFIKTFPITTQKEEPKHEASRMAHLF